MIRSMSQRPVPSTFAYRRASASAALCIAAIAPAQGADLSASGFATLGYARSDQPYGYQRFIDDGGTLRRDSVAGFQLDARLGGGFGATAQVKAAASNSSDDRYQASLAWAFVSYRPDNDWLFRLGKQRIPLYLYSETVDVGATYDFARLPTEMYSISPSNDLVGASFARAWKAGSDEVTLEGYAGKSSSHYRLWLRDGIPGLQAPGAVYAGLTIKGGGLVLTYKADDSVFRFGLHRASGRPSNGLPFAVGFPFVTLAPGVGYFQVDPSLPGPGVRLANDVKTTLVNAGFDWRVTPQYQLMGEFARTIVKGDDIGPQGTRGLLAVLRKAGDWTPYLSYSFLRSPERQREFYRNLNDSTLPLAVPDAALINALQRIGADQLLVVDQNSWAVGTSYALSPASKFKAEFARTRIGDVSSLVDPLPGTTVRNARINVLSLSYSVVF